ncbi:hypothetical protein JCM6882_000639 [Rhodosporidiobolus microsporus]
MVSFSLLLAGFVPTLALAATMSTTRSAVHTRGGHYKLFGSAPSRACGEHVRFSGAPSGASSTSSPLPYETVSFSSKPTGAVSTSREAVHTTTTRAALATSADKTTTSATTTRLATSSAGSATISSKAVASTTSSAAGASSSNSGTFADAVLAAHNEWRAQYGSPAVAWDAEMAANAATYIDACNFQHSSSGYAENLAFSWQETTMAQDGVDMWMEEAANYDYSDPTSTAKGETGHFMNVVWASTTRIGCAEKYCSSLTGVPYDNASGTIFICDYVGGVGGPEENIGEKQ